MAQDTHIMCETLHKLCRSMQRFRFPFDVAHIPSNGLYVLFEKDELSHGGERIVRIGSHTGQDQLRSRLRQHFLMEKKDRSIFRKNIGRCFLCNDPYLKIWELDNTTAAARAKNAPQIEIKKQVETEKQITKYLQKNFSFAVLNIPDKSERLSFEAKCIATVAQCHTCRSSDDWLAKRSSVKQIAAGKLWQSQHLTSHSLAASDLDRLLDLIPVVQHSAS